MSRMGFRRSCHAVPYSILAIFCFLSVFMFRERLLTGVGYEFTGLQRQYPNIQQQIQQIGVVDLTIRLTVDRKLLQYFFCDFLRSTALFWNPSYGPIRIIWDESDRHKPLYKNLQKSNMAYNFEYSFESAPRNMSGFELAGKYMKTRNTGYVIQLYSSFLMDLYTNASVIAWMDSDALFTTVATPNQIMRNGKLVVKGTCNEEKVPIFAEYSRVFLGLPFVANFMVYFPTFLFPSTIRNCREYLLKRFKKSTLEEAFLDACFRGPDTGFVSPVSVILNYAFHYEKHLYEFHIDMWGKNLNEYNKKLLPGHQILPSDTIPAIHLSLHTKFVPKYQDMFFAAVCRVSSLASIPDHRCKAALAPGYYHIPFTFQIRETVEHMNTWCKGEKWRTCADAISGHEENVEDYFRTFEFSVLQSKYVEKFADNMENIKCWNMGF